MRVYTLRRADGAQARVVADYLDQALSELKWDGVLVSFSYEDRPAMVLDLQTPQYPYITPNEQGCYAV